MSTVCDVNGAWYAKEYQHHINVYDANCVFYMKLYKKSTPDAVEKARHFITMMNEIPQIKRSLSTMEGRGL